MSFFMFSFWAQFFYIVILRLNLLFTTDTFKSKRVFHQNDIQYVHYMANIELTVYKLTIITYSQKQKINKK